MVLSVERASYNWGIATRGATMTNVEESKMTTKYMTTQPIRDNSSVLYSLLKGTHRQRRQRLCHRSDTLLFVFLSPISVVHERAGVVVSKIFITYSLSEVAWLLDLPERSKPPTIVCSSRQPLASTRTQSTTSSFLHQGPFL
jgi:hypothetical protein